MNAIAFNWTGEAMVPRHGFQRKADAQFVIGMSYILTVEEQRSMAQHRGYFARIKEAWSSLPDDKIEDFPSFEHLRKHALIMTGFSHQRDFVASSRAEALRIAAFMKPTDEYAVVIVRHAVVRVSTAQSQSVKAMGKEDFKRSIDAVENWVAELLGVSPEEYGRAA
jgi:hypothetical protein